MQSDALPGAGLGRLTCAWPLLCGVTWLSRISRPVDSAQSHCQRDGGQQDQPYLSRIGKGGAVLG